MFKFCLATMKLSLPSRYVGGQKNCIVTVVIIPCQTLSPSICPRKRQQILNMSNQNHCRGQHFICRPLKIRRHYFFPLSQVSLLLGVIQRSNKINMDDRETIFGRQSVSLPNLFVAEDIVHYLPNFVITWKPPFMLWQPSDQPLMSSLMGV